MKELTLEETKEVSGGVLPLFRFIGTYALGRAVDNYVEWAENGAGGWEVEYNGEGYSDPLL